MPSRFVKLWRANKTREKILTSPTTQFEVPPSEKSAGGFRQAGKKEGVGGKEFLPACFRSRSVWAREKRKGGLGGIPLFSCQIKMRPAPPPAWILGRQDTTEKYSFSLGEKEIRRAQNEKTKEYFSVVWRACRAVEGLASLLGVLLKKSSNFVQKTPPSVRNKH